MASMFLVEIVVDELKSYINCKEFYIQSQFSDVFLLNLKDPNGINPFISNVTRKTKKDRRVKNVKHNRPPIEDKVQVGQSILFTSRIDSLITAMKNVPIELSLFDKDEPETVLGTTQIPWSSAYINYLRKLNRKVNPVNVRKVCNSDSYNIYDDTFKRIVTVTLNIKLTHLKDNISSFRSIPEETYNNYTNFGTTTALNTIKEVVSNLIKEDCTIKTINSAIQISNSKTNNASNKYKTSKKTGERQIAIVHKINEPLATIPKQNRDEKVNLKSSRISYGKSVYDLDRTRTVDLIKTKSCSSMNRKHLNILNYVFGKSEASPIRNQVLCVGYFTVEDDLNKVTSSSNDSRINKQNSETPDSKSMSDSKGKLKLRLCHKDCLSRHNERSCVRSMCSLDLPENATDLVTVIKCKHLDCDNKKHREVPPLADENILLDLTNLQTDCCDLIETEEKVVGEMKAKMNFEKEDCFCSCECTFGFVKRTTYCEICGGYEKPGQDLPQSLSHARIPCPIYHKIEKKGSGSDKSARKGSKSVSSGHKNESGKDERFNFKYGFIGIPAKIGHSQCAMPCTGTLGLVPKDKGWLWNADNVPGVKCRPMYKPGAISKHVLRLLKIAKNPDTALKKKRRDTGKPKRPLKRPLLTVAKKDGEYTVTMETMKVFSRPRALNQHPYEDKPVVTYTIGRTEEENSDRNKKKEREKRRLERDQRTFIQSAFTDMCKEICLKTYQQALGILPHQEDPACTCYPRNPGPNDTNLEHSCSCSAHSASISLSSDTDSDEWVVEFTPPNARFDPKYKPKKLTKVDNSTQYTYLDYRVKLLDRYGNQVPRFFKGPDGTTQCSDLGGFWSPDHEWLIINTDGYIGPDERWAPLNFIGPNKELVECNTGKFQANDGTWLVVGVDGYIDSNGKWKFYLKPKKITLPKKLPADRRKKDAGDKKDDKTPYARSDVTWSCFGDATPKDLTKLGILGHGQDKKLLLQTLTDMMPYGKDITIPPPSRQTRQPASKKGKSRWRDSFDTRTNFSDRQRCKHAAPSDKGVVAIDEHGHKTYFKSQRYQNKRTKDRIDQLTHQGISLSSFHTPCFDSFTNREMVKRQQYEKFLKLKPCEHDPLSKCVSTQYRYRYAI